MTPAEVRQSVLSGEVLNPQCVCAACHCRPVAPPQTLCLMCAIEAKR